MRIQYEFKSNYKCPTDILFMNIMRAKHIEGMEGGFKVDGNDLDFDL